jgi:ribosomal protein S18 acetylase RimI-like enzyme
MQLSIRPATGEDAPALQEISAACTPALRAVYRPSPELVRRQNSEDYAQLVASVAGIVVGAVSYTALPEGLYMRDLAVLPTHRRRGVARRFVEHLVELAASQRLPGVTLQTIRETGNVAIFEQLGFAIVSEARTEDFLSPTGSPMTNVSMFRPAAFYEGDAVKLSSSDNAGGD